MILATSPAAAQSTDETINVGMEVTIASEEPVISGLADVSLTWDKEPSPTAVVSDVQTFCLFTPTQFFTMTATSFQSELGFTSFRMFNDLAPDPDNAYLRYNVVFRDAFSGSNASLGSFFSRTPVSDIDSNLFNTDATCSDGDNVSLEISVVGNDQVDSSNTNEDILLELSDGVTRNFSDQLTIVIDTEV